MRPVGNIKFRLRPASRKYRRYRSDIRQMRSAAKRIVDDRHVARRQPERIENVPHRKRHRPQMNGHVIAHRDRLALRVIHGARIVAAVFDIDAECRAPQNRAHLFRNRDKQIAEDFQVAVCRLIIFHRASPPAAAWGRTATDHLYRKGSDRRPFFAIALFDRQRMAPAVGHNPIIPRVGGRGSRRRRGTWVVLLTIFQLSSAAVGFIENVRSPGIRQSARHVPRIEPESLHSARGSLFGNRFPPPRRAAIRSNQEKRIARQRNLSLARRPAMLRVDHLHLFQRGSGNSRRRFLPGDTVVVADEEAMKRWLPRARAGSRPATNSSPPRRCRSVPDRQGRDRHRRKPFRPRSDPPRCRRTGPSRARFRHLAQKRCGKKNAEDLPMHRCWQFYIAASDSVPDPAIIGAWRDCCLCSRSSWSFSPAQLCLCISSNRGTAKW